MYDQINAVLVRIRDFFQNHKEILTLLNISVLSHKTSEASLTTLENAHHHHSFVLLWIFFVFNLIQALNLLYQYEEYVAL